MGNNIWRQITQKLLSILWIIFTNFNSAFLLLCSSKVCLLNKIAGNARYRLARGKLCFHLLFMRSGMVTPLIILFLMVLTIMMKILWRMYEWKRFCLEPEKPRLLKPPKSNLLTKHQLPQYIEAHFECSSPNCGQSKCCVQLTLWCHYECRQAHTSFRKLINIFYVKHKSVFHDASPANSHKKEIFQKPSTIIL